VDWRLDGVAMTDPTQVADWNCDVSHTLRLTQHPSR
jgi:hypothetical protein